MAEAMQMPLIRRARGYRLYDHRGRRYLDLWQNGGRSLLGHRPAGQTTLLKNLLSKGLAADLPSPYTGRLERALAALLPTHGQARVVASPGPLCGWPACTWAARCGAQRWPTPP